MMEKWSPTAKPRTLSNMRQDNVKFCNKNVNLVEKNYIKAQKYLTMKRKLAFYWVIVFVSMTTSIFSHVKDILVKT